MSWALVSLVKMHIPGKLLGILLSGSKPAKDITQVDSSSPSRHPSSQTATYMLDGRKLKGLLLGADSYHLVINVTSGVMNTLLTIMKNFRVYHSSPGNADTQVLGQNWVPEETVLCESEPCRLLHGK